MKEVSNYTVRWDPQHYSVVGVWFEPRDEIIFLYNETAEEIEIHDRWIKKSISKKDIQKYCVEIGEF